MTAVCNAIDRVKTEELGEKPAPVPICPPQIPQELTRAVTSDVRWKIFRNISPENFPFLKIIT
jgi:hypothetical protein